jgi:hypothetical protein
MHDKIYARQTGPIWPKYWLYSPRNGGAKAVLSSESRPSVPLMAVRLGEAAEAGL